MSMMPLAIYGGGAAPILPAPTFFGVSNTWRTSGTTNLAPALPASVPDGAQLYMMTVVMSLTETVATPPGWTLVSGPDDCAEDGHLLRGYLWRKVASSEGASVSGLTKTGTTSNSNTAIVAYTGGTHFDAAVEAPDDHDTNVPVPSVDVDLVNSMLVIMCGHKGGFTSISVPAVGYTERLDNNGANEPLHQVADKVATEVGATGATSQTLNGGGVAALAYHIAISPTG